MLQWCGQKYFPDENIPLSLNSFCVSGYSDIDPNIQAPHILNIYNWVWLWVCLWHAVVFSIHFLRTYPTYGSQGARNRTMHNGFL